MPAPHLVRNATAATSSWALADLILPDGGVFAAVPKTFATINTTAVELEDSSNSAAAAAGVVLPPRSVIDPCPEAASTLIGQPSTPPASAGVVRHPSASLQMLPFIGQPNASQAESTPPSVLEHGYSAETLLFDAARQSPHGVAAGSTDEYHDLRATEVSSPARARLPQTVPHHEVASGGGLAPAPWDETGSTSGCTTSETTGDATLSSPCTTTSSSCTTSTAAAAGGAAPAPTLSRPSLCVCKKLAVPAMLLADSAAMSCAAGASAGGVGAAGERPGRVCASRGKKVRL